MKRALVFSSLGPGSGAALRARYLCEALARQGFDARLQLPFLPNLPFSLEALAAIPGFALRAAMWRADLAVGIKPYPNCWLALWIAGLRGAKAVMDVDDLDSAWRGGVARLISSLLQAPAFRLLRRFSTHHPAIRSKLAGHGEILELSQGVDTAIFSPGKKSSEKLLLFTAHLNVACQLEFLMPLLEPWLQRHPGWRLLVAGGGPKLGFYKRKFESAQVGFSGPLSPESTAAWVRRAAICVSAYSEGGGNEYRVPMKVGEYLACKKPVVTNLIPGLQALRSFLYFCGPSPKAFARQLDRICLGKGDGRELRGAAWVRKHLSWDRVALCFLKELG